MSVKRQLKKRKVATSDSHHRLILRREPYNLHTDEVTGGGPMKRVKSPEVVKAQQGGLFKVVADGNTYAVSCFVMKVSHSTFQRWREMDPTFQAQVEKAEARAIMQNIAVIQKATDKHWQVAALRQERLAPSSPN